MKIQVLMDVDKKLAILENKDACGIVTLELETKDLTEEERKELLTLRTKPKSEGGAFYGYDAGVYPVRWGIPISEANLENFRFVLHDHKRWRLEREAKDAREEQEWHEHNRREIVKWMNNPEGWSHTEREVYPPSLSGFLNMSSKKRMEMYLDEIPGFKDALDDAESFEFWLQLEDTIGKMRRNRLHSERLLAEKRAEEEAEAKKAAYIKKWVAEKGTASQKERMAEGLLPQDEVVNAIRDEVFAPLTDFARYEKIKASEICTCEYEPCDVDFDSNVMKSATESQFELIKEIKRLVPGATIELKEHIGKSERCENEEKRVGVLVTVGLEGFRFSREYAA